MHTVEASSVVQSPSQLCVKGKKSQQNQMEIIIQLYFRIQALRRKESPSDLHSAGYFFFKYS